MNLSNVKRADLVAMTVSDGIKRNCVRCGNEITKCFGFMLARDFGKLRPREICGNCAIDPTIMEWIASYEPMATNKETARRDDQAVQEAA